MFARAFASLCLLLTLSVVASAQITIHVPADKPTIQAGIDAANTGDTVLVAPGTYTENIDFKGKAITVTSSDGPAKTVLDGGGKGGSATVMFSSRETSASIISKFTIRNGGNTIFGGNGDGGVYVSDASPTIRDNVITANYCHNIDVEFGTATILDNEISGVLQDTAEVQGKSYCTFGSGVNLQGTPFYDAPGSVVIGNTIENNLTGSAINLWAAQNVLIRNNVLRNNISPDPGSALISANSIGTVLFGNLIYGNTSLCGGALGFMDAGSSSDTPSILIANNTIVDNVTGKLTGGSECTQISQIYPDPYSYGYSGPGAVVINNIISGSTPYPAVNCDWYAAPTEANQPTFRNNILYNAGGAFFGPFCVDVSRSDSNIVADPQFVNPAAGDYHLKSTSPAIDSGQNSVLQTFLAMTGQSIATDFDGNSRVQDATGKGCVIDMGAYEAPGTRTVCGTTETLTSSLNPSTFGQNVTFTAQLTSSSGVPTGSVQFTDGTTLLGTEAVSVAGMATITTSLLSVGTHTITATFQPTGNFPSTSASLTQVVNGYATATLLSASSNPATVGRNVTFTATVSSPSGTPSGSVTFVDGTTSLATSPLNSGVATYSTSALPIGTHHITATYTTSGAFAGSTAALAETINGLAATATVSASPASTIYGTPITLSATVSAPNASGPPVPSGSVTFLNGSTPLGTVPLTAGSANLTVSTLPGGTDPLTCSYSGDTTYAAATCNVVPVTVAAAPSALTLTSSANPTSVGSPPRLTLHLTAKGQPAPAGTAITITIGANSILSVLTDASGAASTVAPSLLPGSYPVTAIFAGNNSLQPSTASLTEVLTGYVTATALTSSLNPAYQGQNLTFSVDVSVSSSTAAPAFTGSVTFYDGTTVLAVVPVSASGQATLSSSTLRLGTHALSAAFATNGVFVGSTSPVIQQTILPSTFTIALNPASITIKAGQSGTTSIALASVGAFTDPLTLSYGAMPTYASANFNPGTVTLTAGGTASTTLHLNTAQDPGTVATSTPPIRGSRFIAFALLLSPLALVRSRRRVTLLHTFLILLVLAASTQVLTGCGTVGYPFHLVEAGTYRIPITATDTNHNTKSTTLTVVITP